MTKLVNDELSKKNTVLFIGHAFHLKTKSSQFFIDILKKDFKIDFLWIDPYSYEYINLENVKNRYFDIILLWQLMPEMSFLIENFAYEKLVLCPMYDQVANIDRISFDLFEPFAEGSFICFSKTLYDGLVERGYNSLYVQYFPKPLNDIVNFGSSNSVFFWNRRENLNINLVQKLTAGMNVKSIYIHKTLDPNQKFIEPDDTSAVNYFYSEWFETKEQMYEVMDKSSIYIAPRILEGIGMSFLDAMARGRCVIAPNFPTMNEYIQDGVTGILYDYDNPTSLQKYDIKQIQKNTIEYIKNGYNKWQEDKINLVTWLKEMIAPAEQKKMVIITKVKDLYSNNLVSSFIKNVNSVSEQKYSSFVHYVIDEGSTDCTNHLLCKYEKLGVITTSYTKSKDDLELLLPVEKMFVHSYALNALVSNNNTDGLIIDSEGYRKLSVIASEQRNKKFKNYFDLLIKWLEFDLTGKKIYDYFSQKKYCNIAIYGIGKIGKILYKRLQEENITVDYFIDNNVRFYEGKKIYSLNMKLPEVDVIVVTTNFIFEDVETALRMKTLCPIVNIDEIFRE